MFSLDISNYVYCPYLEDPLEILSEVLNSLGPSHQLVLDLNVLFDVLSKVLSKGNQLVIELQVVYRAGRCWLGLS